MKVSIALATYNGEKFLKDQLDSFLKQSHRPDELVVCDDSSIDSTIEILEKFSAAAPFRVRIFKNDERLGYRKNFSKVMTLARGEFVFLSDQDDVWYENKIRAVLDTFERNANACLVINNACLTSSDLQQQGRTQLGNIEALGLPDSRFIMGCCTAVRSNFLQACLPVPDAVYGHDTWLNNLADLMGGRVVLRECLQDFRRHDNNTSGWLASSYKGATRFDLFRKHGLKSAEYGWRAAIERGHTCRSQLKLNFKKFSEIQLDSSVLSAIERIDGRNRVLRKRIAINKLARPRRFPIIFRQYQAGYYSNFDGWRSAVKDAIRK